MGREKQKPSARDPKGHSLRVYSNVYDSAAFAALSPHDVLAYLALLRELKGFNNGDLSLPLTRAKKCGISHHITLARSLRALCAVGLVAITRKGGCDKGGQRLATLYRITDRECFQIPAKYLEAIPETNEWRHVASAAHGRELIQAAEDKVKTTTKTKTAGHAVTATVSRHDLVLVKTMSRHDTWEKEPCHGVTMAESDECPASARVVGLFSMGGEKAIHRTPHRPPIYLAIHGNETDCSSGHGAYQRLRSKPACSFTRLIGVERLVA